MKFRFSYAAGNRAKACFRIHELTQEARRLIDRTARYSELLAQGARSITRVISNAKLFRNTDPKTWCRAAPIRR